MTKYICIKDGKFHASHKIKKGDFYWVRTSHGGAKGEKIHYHLYQESDKHKVVNRPAHFLDGYAYKIGLPSHEFSKYLIPIEQYREEQIDELLSEPPFFQVDPMTFNPKKSIIERYGSKETIREIKIDKILK